MPAPRVAVSLASLRGLAAIAVALTTATPAIAEEVEGFTEPYREVNLAAADTGLVAELFVREGQGVRAGELVAALDTQVLEATQQIAERHVASSGKIDSAKAELRLRQARVDKFEELLGRAHASQEELDRAEIDRDIAAATLLVAEEERAIRRLERDRIAVQLDRRTVRSPIDGVIVERLKEAGEFVSPADPIVMRVVQLDPLRATFSVPEDLAVHLTEGESAIVRLQSPNEDEREVRAQIEFVSPVIDSESGTVQVRTRIANPYGQIRAGQRCSLEVLPVEQVAERP